MAGRQGPYRRDFNSTGYVHPNEENLNNLHRAMEYNDAGEPVIRTAVDGDITIGELNVDNVEIANDVGNPIPVIGTVTNPWGATVLQVDDDTVQHTSKNRRKISGYEVIQFGSFIRDIDPGTWDQSITGTADAVFDEHYGMVELTVGDSPGDEIVRQTRRVVRYTPGRSNELSMSHIFTEPTLGVRRRCGVFTETDGAYFEDGGDGTYYVVLRRNTSSGPVETRVARENWNVDALDGTGPSGITADPTAIQLMVIEYEWYGAGHVEFKFVIGNNSIPVHEFNTANIDTQPWASTPFLPIRCELTNVSGATGVHSFWQGSHSVQTEGETGPLGQEFAVTNNITGTTLSNANIFYPVLSIRLKNNSLDGIVIPIDFQAATLDNTNIFYRVVLNPVLTGASWQSVREDSEVEYDVSATAQSDGTILKSGFLSSGVQGQLVKFSNETATQLGRGNMGSTSDIITVEIASINANKSAFAMLNWIEVK